MEKVTALPHQVWVLLNVADTVTIPNILIKKKKEKSLVALNTQQQI